MNVLRNYVFSRLKADTFLSHSHVVTSRVEKILKHSVMLAYIPESISFKVAATVAGTVLGFLPIFIRTATSVNNFKSQLKTYYFKLAYF